MTPRSIPYLVLLPALLGTALALAQARAIPADAKRAFIRHVQEARVTVNGKPMQLAPGATIRNAQDLLTVPVSIPRDGAWAEYTMDGNGQISRVWLLTPEELKRPRRRGG
jgi:hypothetical protein